MILTERRQHTAKNHEGKKQRGLVENLEGEGKAEGQLRKSLQIERKNGQQLEEESEKQPDAAADEIAQQKFHLKGGEDAVSLKAGRPQSAELVGAAGNCGLISRYIRQPDKNIPNHCA